MKKRHSGLLCVCALAVSACVITVVSASDTRTDEERFQKLLDNFHTLPNIEPHGTDTANTERVKPATTPETEDGNPLNQISCNALTGEVTIKPYEPGQESGQNESPPFQGDEPSGGLLDPQFYSNPALTAVDLKDNFEHYAEPEATVTIPETYDPEDRYKSNVVGVVLDASDNTPIANASVYVDGEFVVATGSNGRFQILGLLSGTYDWTVMTDTHKEGQFLGYTIGDYSTDIFTFYVDKDEEIIRRHAYQFETALPDNWTSGEG